MKREIRIGNRIIGTEAPTYIIAEMSGNHNHDYSRAEELIYAAKDAGVDAVKIQTYTADTITLNSDKPYFQTRKGGLWKGRTLYDLYQEAFTPWEWQPKLKELADKIGIDLFSSPFDISSVDFLEGMEVPAYKIASFEILDIPLIKRVAKTGKPIIISTGIANLSDIELAIDTCLAEGNDNVVLLKCTSAYPAPFEYMNLKTIPNMSDTFSCLSGLSDHSLGDEISVAAVALGASVIEKHFTLKRSDGGVDSAFSLEAEELKMLVQKIRNVEKAMGCVDYSMTEEKKIERHSGRSLFAAKSIRKGEFFTAENIRSVRPNIGLHTKYYEEIIGKKALQDIEFAEPIKEGMIEW